MDNQEAMNKEVGDKDIPKLEAKDIEVQGTVVKPVGVKKTDIVVLLCKHPDKDEVIELTKIKLLRNDNAKTVGLWFAIDEDNKIQKGSSVAELLKLAKVGTLADLTGVTLPTIEESKDSSYLCIKGY